MAPSVIPVRWLTFAIVALIVPPLTIGLESCPNVCDECTDRRLDCPAIRLQKAYDHLEVRCVGKRSSFDRVRNMTDVPRFANFRQLSYFNCPMPTGRHSLAEMLDIFVDPKTIGSIEQLFFVGNADVSERTPLDPALFTGFDSLRNLSLKRASVLPLDNPRLFEALPQLEWLDLRDGDGGEGLEPTILHPLTNMHTLELMRNGLVTLPEGLVANLPNLRKLKLFGNQLERFDRLAGTPRLAEIDLSSNELTTLPADAFAELPALERLVLTKNQLTSLPEGLLLNNRNLTIFEATDQATGELVLPERLFANLTRLEYVFLADSNVKELPGSTFEMAVALYELHLGGNALTTLPPSLLADQHELVELDLQRNRLHTLPDELFAKTTRLSVLRLSHNRLQTLNDELLQPLTMLTKLYLDNNQLRVIDLSAFRGQRMALDVLDLSKNQLSFRERGQDVFYQRGRAYMATPKQTPFIELDHVRLLNLSGNALTNVLGVFKGYMQNLRTLDLSDNQLTVVEDDHFPFLANVNLLDLRRNRIARLELDTALDGVRLPALTRLDENPLQCDCRLHPFVTRLLDQDPVTAQFEIANLQCTSPPELQGLTMREIHPSTLLCAIGPEDKFCPSECSCHKRPFDRVVLIDCSAQNLSHVPSFPVPISDKIVYTSIELNLQNNHLRMLPVRKNETTDGWAHVHRLNVAHNHLTVLEPDSLPRMLGQLDVSANRLVSFDPELTQLLADRRTLRNISLAANPWHCDCDAPLLTFVHDNIRRVTDSRALRCADGRPINSGTLGELCAARTTVIVSLCVTFALIACLAAIMAGLYYRYEHEVKVWLFKHNLLQWFVAEEQLDRDKRYDAFISYSHKDEDFVSEYLMPKLEGDPMNFRVCWHVRDFMPGELISTQITRAVEESRRTIIVLSNNYLESVWGQMEFKTAYLQSVEDRCNRVIAIIYDDIGNVDELDAELRAYLKTNTYLRWGDHWFWDKLRYAMPHRPRPRGADNIRMASVDKLNLLQPANDKQVASVAESTPPIEKGSPESPLTTYVDEKNTPPFMISNGKLDLHVPE